MHSCPSCNSDNLNKRGTFEVKSTSTIRQRYFCRDCESYFSVDLPKVSENYSEVIESNRYVITSYQPDTEINHQFLSSLKSYCQKHAAKLIILTTDKERIFEYVDEADAVDYNFELGDFIRVYAGLNLSKTAENPLAGIDGLSKGKSIIVGHPVLQMKTLPVFGDSHPIMITSTGTLSHPDYDTSKKSGAKAEFNHSYSALIVELDNENTLFHLRVLNCDENNSFYDLGYYYSPDYKVEFSPADAIVLGDTHVTDNSEQAVKATFNDNDSIVNLLKPKKIVHHDLLDFGLMQSHHNAKSFIKRYEKFMQGKDNVKKELQDTVKFLEDNTPDFVEENIIVSSNHNDHFTQYLENVDARFDYKNAKLYHFMMYNILNCIESGEEVNPFKIYFDNFCKNIVIKNKTKFLGREDVYYIHDILISSHGDKGSGGSRFSPTQGSKYPSKTITGHSHCFQDGHSALTRDGWKSIKDIQVGEYVLAFDHTKNRNVWVENQETHVNDFSGTLIDINTQYMRQVVTPNHNLFTIDGDYVNVCEYVLTNTPAKIPLQSLGIDESSDYIKYTDEDLRKIVCIVSDAYITNGKDVRFHLKKQRKIDRLKLLFGDDIKSYTNTISNTGSIHFSISKSSKSYKDIKNFGILGDKSLPQDFISLSKRQKEIVLNELSHCDGTFISDESKNGRQWSSTNKKSVDIVSVMVCELGHRNSVYTKNKLNTKKHRTQWIISWCADRTKIWNKDYITSGKDLARMWGIQPRKVENIKVYCLTTPLNNFWVRNDETGKVSLTGNSPSITKGAYVVGTMTGKQDYTAGTPTSWMNTHCVIYPNGKRQLISIINGKWYL